MDPASLTLLVKWLHKLGPPTTKECLPNKTVLDGGGMTSEGRGCVYVCVHAYVCVRVCMHIGCCARFGRGASLYRHRSQLFGRLWIRLKPPTGQFS